jgi:hypothetical protein
MRTWATPACRNPSATAASVETSITRPRMNGPRPMIVTTALRPLSRLTTRTCDPIGRLRCAANSPGWCEYWKYEANPCSAAEAEPVNPQSTAHEKTTFRIRPALSYVGFATCLSMSRRPASCNTDSAAPRRSADCLLDQRGVLAAKRPPPGYRVRRRASLRCAAPYQADDPDQQTRADEPSNQVADPSA